MLLGYAWISAVDGGNPANNLGCQKPCKEWDKLPTSTGGTAGFLNHHQYDWFLVVG